MHTTFLRFWRLSAVDKPATEEAVEIYVYTDVPLEEMHSQGMHGRDEKEKGSVVQSSLKKTRFVPRSFY